MSASSRTAKSVVEAASESQGLWRTVLAGPGRSLADAFASLERSPQVERVIRHPKRDLLSARVTLTPEEGRGYWELMRIRNELYVVLTNFAYKNPRFEFVPGDGLVQFNFTLSGDLNYAVSRSESLRFNRPSLHVWRQPHGVDMSEWTAPSAHERTVAISIQPKFLVDHFLSTASDVPAHLRAFASPAGSHIDFCQVPLTAQMAEICSKLLDNPYRGTLALMYAEALTLELLCAAVGNFWSLPDRPTEEFSERELGALGKARALLMRQFAPAPSLKKIARAVGMAEKALTGGFKAVYGETVFDFSLRCRMQHALGLLRDRHWSVDRVADAVGYAHPTSFTAAFRRHFGMRPIDMKRLKARP